MDKNKVTREQISALADGELTGSQAEAGLSVALEPEGGHAWEVYHQIGDLLRSDDMAIALSPDFAARMAAKLETEPTFTALAALPEPIGTGATSKVPGRATVKRFAVPGIAAAAMAIAAVVGGPQLMVALRDVDPAATTPQTVAETDTAGLREATMPTSPVQVSRVMPAALESGVVLRDPHIDEYLMAHQRFSPSVYSTAQYVRSATLATDSDQ